MKSHFCSIDPEKVGETRRKLMMDNRQYYVADYWKSNMMKDTPITGRYFRIRRYIKRRDPEDYGEEWPCADLSKVWSTVFIGLSSDGFQKLEFQNPPYSAAYRLGGDPRHFNDAFVIQVNGCNYECSYCFNDRTINRAEPSTGKYFSAEEMLDVFLHERAKCREAGGQLNVIRLSGGEVTSLVPELILDIMEGLDVRGLSDSIYVWADCNLSTPKYLVPLQQDLKEVAGRKNFGVVGCLKTVGDEENGKRDFSLITKARPEYFSRQFDTLDFLVNNLKADTYVYIVPISWGDEKNSRERLFSSAKRLSRIHRNLPLRVNIIKIRPYDVAKTNMINASREGRPLGKYDENNFEQWCEKYFLPSQRYIFRIWYREILTSFYKTHELERYRCEAVLD